MTQKPVQATSQTTAKQPVNVEEVGALEERVVDVGMPEGLKLLKASLQSKTVLTSVFFGNTGAEEVASFNICLTSTVLYDMLNLIHSRKIFKSKVGSYDYVCLDLKPCQMLHLMPIKRETPDISIQTCSK
ncbi:hypothetical protein RHGRI_027492 [Rhododendron griersonianum]|uniref:Uncharacterized protein n=1 Tax=Rhododendron griersonianum TaxID=479676 RepID=A0AAV6IYM7_9ERIC|nr:hypothetical protein RHGRI_027492 [Rhododendron griersonianum]